MQNSPRYIDADKMLSEESEAYIRAQCNVTDEPTYFVNQVVHKKLQKILSDAPTADVVEVVRCKDCLYCEDFGMSGLFCNHPDDRNPVGCRPGDFCSDGRKRKKVQNDRETEKNSIAE